MKDNIHIFVDMDNVITDWVKHFYDKVGVDYRDVPRNESFKITKKFPVEWWATMPWMPDGKELWDYVTDHFENIHILSSPTRDSERKSYQGKLIWLEEKGIMDQIGEENIIITPDKHEHVEPEGISILIDDTQKKIDGWRNAGGIGIHHTTFKESLPLLKKYL